MRSGVVMVKNKVDITVNVVLFLPISVWNWPFMSRVFVVPPITETGTNLGDDQKTNLGDDLPVDNSGPIPPHAPHDLFCMKGSWNALGRIATVNTHLLSLDVVEE